MPFWRRDSTYHWLLFDGSHEVEDADAVFGGFAGIGASVYQHRDQVFLAGRSCQKQRCHALERIFGQPRWKNRSSKEGCSMCGI